MPSRIPIQPSPGQSALACFKTVCAPVTAPTRSAFLSALFAITASISPTLAVPHYFWANPSPTGMDFGGVDFESETTGYAVGEFGVTFRTTDAGITWAAQNDLGDFGPRFFDVLALGAGELLTVGAAPGIFRSVDGGASWTPIANPSTAPLQNLFQLDADTIFAVGNGSAVLKSTDSGATWVALTAATTSGMQLVDQWWLTESTGFAVGTSNIFRTTNGGTSWALAPGLSSSPTFFSGDMQFLDTMNGWTFLDFATYRTTNGGNSWVQLPMNFANSPIYQDEAVVLDAQTWIVGTEAEGAGLWKTTDGGAHWTSPFLHDGSRGITDLERLSTGEIVAVSSDGDLLRSTDDGSSWSNFTNVAGPPPRKSLSAIDVLPESVGFAAGWGAAWLQTTDGGATWFTPSAVPAFTDIFALDVRDPLFALAGGQIPGQSIAARTTDGGATWTNHALSPTYKGYAQAFVSFPDGTCFCVTHGGTGVNFVFRSTDHGSTWQERSDGLSTPRLFDLSFLDAQRGFVCGGDFSSHTLARTTDGGGSWTPVGGTGLAIDLIRDTHWFDPQTGLIVGDDLIQRTTNGGASWITVAVESGCTAVDFSNGNVGYANSLTQKMLRTTDRGATWQDIALPFSGFVDDVCATPHGVLAVSESNEIFGFTDEGVGLGAEEIVSLPPAEHVMQLLAWPNPVSLAGAPAIAFAWRASPGFSRAMQPVTARLFDLRGRLLHATELTLDAAGRGSMTWEGKSLSPGVVALQLTARSGETVSTKVTLARSTRR